MSLKVFSNISHYKEDLRYPLNNIIKSLWNERSQAERRQVYGAWVDLYQYEPDIQKADLCLLTYQWPYYVDQGLLAQAQAEVEAAQQHGKPLVIFSAGDAPANIPFQDVILFDGSAVRPLPGLRYLSAQPPYIADYLQEYCAGELQLRQKSDVARIGFCGQASTSALQNAWRSLRLRFRQAQYRCGRLKWAPPPFETTGFRTSVLRQFENQPGLQTDYLLRKRYHGGRVDDSEAQAALKREFVANVLGTDYTVCMRGGGNFSLRFYETLCLGRIPVFINTGCVLPFDDQVPYREIFPWVELDELEHAAQIVRDFHARLSGEAFEALQRNCRALWEQHMTPTGFHQDFVRKMEKLVKNPKNAKN